MGQGILSLEHLLLPISLTRIITADLKGQCDMRTVLVVSVCRSRAQFRQFQREKRSWKLLKWQLLISYDTSFLLPTTGQYLRLREVSFFIIIVRGMVLPHYSPATHDV